MRIYGRAGQPGFKGFFYAPDAGAGSGGGSQGGNAGGQSGDTGAGASGGKAGGNNSEGDGGDDGDDGKPVYSKRVLSDKIREEKAKVKRQLERDLLEGVGLTKEGVDEFKKWKEDRAAAEIERQKKEGKFQEIIEQNSKRHQDELGRVNSEKSALLAKYHGSIKRGTVLSLASELGAHAPEEVFQLVQGNFKVNEDESLEVVNANGEPSYDSNGKPFTVKTFLAEWLQKRPYFLRASGGGSGTPGAGGGSGKGGGKKFTRTQIADIKFYEANRDEILAAQKRGDIINE